MHIELLSSYAPLCMIIKLNLPSFTVELNKMETGLGHSTYAVYRYHNIDDLEIIVAVFPTETGKSYDFSGVEGMMYEMKVWLYS